MDAELRDAARGMGREEARFLVDTYYQMQDYRKASANQLGANERGTDDGPMRILTWLCDNVGALEDGIKRLMEDFASQHEVGQWTMSVYGIGPVISAGLLAHIDIERAATVGSIWRFAGVDPSQEWLGKEGAERLVGEVLGRTSGALEEGDIVRVARAAGRKPEAVEALLARPGKDGKPPARTRASLARVMARKPWNGQLKTLLWKISDSFVKFSGREECIYGQWWREHWEWQKQQNEAGAYAEKAASVLAAKPSHKQGASYAEGRLPDSHVLAQSKRWAVKLFVAHWHEVAYWAHFGAAPPNPYVLEHIGGRHVHRIDPPGWTRPG